MQLGLLLLPCPLRPAPFSIPSYPPAGFKLNPQVYIFELTSAISAGLLAGYSHKVTSPNHWDKKGYHQEG
ncbi:hypothetical protein CLOM_g16056 [Closterium sp. NIES-68]|nr:hypothetical protein CLOM_g16056 [Closterium sp. NIES-68]GJP59233.1 hypothetical protein CLOP_g9959 [Closterium sp. NIES-67]